MHKLDYSALSADDRKAAYHLYRVLLIVYSAALVLLGAFAITSSTLFPPTATAEGYVRNEMARDIEAPSIAIMK
jgi:hypothetical protein